MNLKVNDYIRETDTGWTYQVVALQGYLDYPIAIERVGVFDADTIYINAKQFKEDYVLVSTTDSQIAEEKEQAAEREMRGIVRLLKKFYSNEELTDDEAHALYNYCDNLVWKLPKIYDTLPDE